MNPDHHALAIATAIAESLANPATSRTSPSGHRPTPQSLANGAAGIALLHIERALAGDGEWQTAHAWLTVAAHSDLSAGPNAGLYFGAPALAFVTHVARMNVDRYRRAFAVLDTATISVTRAQLDDAHARMDRGDRPTLAEFDLLRGLTGLGAYHLRRDPQGEMTAAVLAYLVRLTEPLAGRTDGLPGWWAQFDPLGRATPGYAEGHGNFGMAHGIAGPLALLSLAMRRGVVVDGHDDAIDRICSWLDAWRQDHPAGPWWPRTITSGEVAMGRPRQSGPLQPSWCYGTPGLARAQQLAGLAVGDIQRQRIAEAAILGCLRDPAQMSRIVDSSLCHGLAGLIHSVWRMAADSPTSDIAVCLPELSAKLLVRLRSSPQGPELLEEAAGTALTLYTAGTGTAPLSSWDACLLLA